MELQVIRSVFETVAIGVGSLSALIAAVAYAQSRKNLQFSVMIACIERFQELLPQLKDEPTSEHDALRYLDLCNEELFYFQQQYLRREVALEWIEGMLTFLPLIDPSGKPWSGQEHLRSVDQLIHRFPRVAHALTSAAPPAPSSNAVKRELAECVLARAMRYRY